MIELTIKTIDLERIKAKLDKLDIKDSGQALASGFQTAALFVEATLKTNISGSILKVRSGRLRSSIGNKLTREEDTLKATIGSGVRQGDRLPYANIHEEGGTIMPKAARFLTIPLKDAKTSAGVTRFTARDLMNGQTNYTGSFISKGIIFGTLGKGRSKKIIPLFVLKKSVNIPARHYMEITAGQTSQGVVEIILKKIDEVLNQ